MKVLFCCWLLALVTEGLGSGYHNNVGVREAARIQEMETQEMEAQGMSSGKKELEEYDNPHLAGLLITLTTGQLSVCSGTLLSHRKVLTAAQCWYDGYSQGKSVQVVVGNTRLYYGSRYEVTSISIHPHFDPWDLGHDLAVLTTKYNIYLSDNVKPALLLPLSEVNSTLYAVPARVSGYGKTIDRSIDSKTAKRSASVPIIGWSIWSCWAKLPPRPINVFSRTICTMGPNGGGTCGADLGGPLLLDNFYNLTTRHNSSAVLIGVTSIQSGSRCGQSFATGYVSVPGYLGWILHNL